MEIEAVPRLLTLSGGSMEPTIRKGWTVQVNPLREEPGPGRVVVIRGAQAWIVHRVVAVDLHEPALVLHRGDAMGGVGACRREDVVGEVVALVSPMGPLPELAGGPPRRAFDAARRRCALYLALRRAARATGIHRSGFLRRVLTRTVDRLLLR